MEPVYKSMIKHIFKNLFKKIKENKIWMRNILHVLE